MEKDRKSFVGGSDAAAAMGISKWTSPLQLWSEKTGKIIPEDISTREYVEMGHELEDTVARLFTKRTGMKVRRAPKNYTHKIYPYMQCQVDRLIEGTDELLECKTCNAWAAKDWEGEEIPRDYIIQVMYQLMVTGRRVGWIACLIGGQKFVYKKIEFDQTLANKIEEGVIAFWKMVQDDIAPMAVGDDNEFIGQLYPESDDQIQAVEEFNDRIAMLQQIKNTIKESEDQKDEIEAGIKQAIGKNSGLKTSEYIVTWKSQTSSRLDSKTLKIEEPEIFNKYKYQTESRTLRVRLNKGEKK